MSIVPHASFRIFACMNPPMIKKKVSAGKKALPQALRSRFSEFFVNEVNDNADLNLVTQSYFKDFTDAYTEKIVEFFQYAKAKSETGQLFDG